MSISDQPAVELADAGGVELIGPWELIRVSRIGLMASHLWLYFLPVALAGGGLDAAFWIGALYVTVPLGLLIYGWNDFFDGDVDAASGRKARGPASVLFGYRLPPSKRRLLPLYIAALHVPFVAAAVIGGRPELLGWLAVMVLGNWLYNGPGVRLSRKPVIAELTATWIYLNILWLSVLITGLAQPLAVWALAAAAVLVFQVGGAIVDIEADRKVGKRTFAVIVGERASGWALIALVVVKAAIFAQVFGEPVAAFLNLLAIPACVLTPALPRFHWAGLTYAYFVIVDWVSLGLLAT